MKMTTLLKASTAALVLSTGAAFAESHTMTVPEGVELADEQTFVYRVLDEHSSVDPGIVEDVSGSEIVRDLFEGLYNDSKDGSTLLPGVALDHTVSEDGLTYTFNLREDAVWSNGEPVTANDFVYAWRRAASPELASPYAWYMSLLSLENVDAVIAGDAPLEDLGVEAIDDYTLEVRLTEPLPYFPQMLTHATTFPVPQAVVEEHGDAWTRPENIVSNGAYVLSEHVPQERSVRTKSDSYWNADQTVIEEVTALVINDENQALTRFLAGELDRTEVPAGQFPRLSEEYPEQTVSFPRLCNYYYTFNLRDNGPEAFQDVNVRRALALAVDRNVIVENVLAGGQTPAYTFTPAATANFEPPETEMASMTQAERDEQAAQLLEEAGYTEDDPLTFEMKYNTSEAHRSIAVAMSQMWAQKLPVEVNLANQEWQTFLEARDSGDFELARGAWCGDYNEASTFLDLLQTDSGYNDAKYSNAEVDQLLAEAKTAENPNELYEQVEQIVAEELPIIPIYFYAGNYMMDEQLIPSWPVENVQQNWYSKDLYFVAESELE
ncbi:peptide ABC transporter substrate-binding protein [Histidinibacterium aquaticum]|uniref:Peptide ABC transporter substrate-binding protein n=1 Tax=Histidinibacterium aquaticum TaxID=2613962 RepID=A0A5J5GRW9_9RHOB|nr:peptide ABC transporter substrate-binding protein [Histidinibacterium aquaticum]KAA9010413.1 peptide ABC transporter substrate-binding protein [Histidinibacterium aquaticum]